MHFFGTSYALGLDMGQAAVKAVVLSRSGSAVSLDASGILDLRSEGILDESELYRELRPWLENQGWHNHETTVSIPQYVASTQVTDFPPGNSTNLDEMVGYETQHLAGLSEESFVHDYQAMPAHFGRRNPVLIGICRESVINERADNLRDANVMLSDLSISSTALAAAYLKLYPEQSRSETPQMVVDVGAENTTIAILAGGDLLYTASLMCGTDRYIQILAQQLGVSLEQAEAAKHTRRINTADTNSPTMTAARIFESELRNTIEEWRSDERPEIGRVQFSRVCLCGGGAYINGLDAYLGSLLDCPFEIVGVKTENTEPNPLLMTAYGLALQGVNSSTLAISLAPRPLRRQVHHRRRFPYLAAAVMSLALLAGSIELKSYLQLHDRQQELDNIDNRLSRSSKIIPELETVNLQINLFERILLPYVEKCNHAGQLAAVIRELNQARASLELNPQGGGEQNEADAWVIYLADENTYHAGKRIRPEEKERHADRNPGRRPGFLLPEPHENGAALPQDVTATTVQLDATDIKPWVSFVAAVYATQPDEQPLSEVRALTEALSKSAFFQNSMEDRVDTFQDKNIRGREDIFRPWLDSAINLNKYRRAVIRLPLSDNHHAIRSQKDENTE